MVLGGFDFGTVGSAAAAQDEDGDLETEVYRRVLGDRLGLQSAMVAVLGSEPTHTNINDKHDPPFVGCLDYIFGSSSRLRVIAALAVSPLRVPPVQVGPSDHLPLCAEYSFA